MAKGYFHDATLLADYGNFKGFEIIIRVASLSLLSQDRAYRYRCFYIFYEFFSDSPSQIRQHFLCPVMADPKHFFVLLIFFIAVYRLHCLYHSLVESQVI